jgi:hypothetical protein
MYSAESSSSSMVHHLTDDLEVVAVGGFAEKLEALFAEALKRVRRTARLERPAPDDAGSGARYDFRGLLDLVARFHAARARHHDHFRTADFDIAHFDDGAFRAEAAAGELVRRDDAVGFFHTLHDFEKAEIEIVFTADAAEHGVHLSSGPVDVEIQVH